MFQKRHMEAIAATLKRAKPVAYEKETANAYVKRLDRWSIMVHQFSNMLQDSNPRYQSPRFLKAAGLIRKDN